MPETIGLLTCTMCNNHSTASSISNEVKVLARSTNSNLHRGIRAMVFQRGLSFDRTGNHGTQILSKNVCLLRTICTMHISSHFQKQINRFSYSLYIGEYTIQWLAELYTKIQFKPLLFALLDFTWTWKTMLDACLETTETTYITGRVTSMHIWLH